MRVVVRSPWSAEEFSIVEEYTHRFANVTDASMSRLSGLFYLAEQSVFVIRVAAGEDWIELPYEVSRRIVSKLRWPPDTLCMDILRFMHNLGHPEEAERLCGQFVRLGRKAKILK